MRAGACTPASTFTKAKRSTGRARVTASARLTVRVGAWHFDYVIDADPPSGVLRDIAQTVAGVTGCGPDVAVGAVTAAIGAPPVVGWEAAA
jgi:hypothetical protein